MGQVADRSFGVILRDALVDYRVRITAACVGWFVLQNLLVGNLPNRVSRLSEPLGATAVVLILSGLAVRSWAAGTLRKGKDLTTDGIYHLCRHPLYLGSILILSGFG